MGPVETLSDTAIALEHARTRGHPATRIEGARAGDSNLYQVVVGEAVHLWVEVDDWWGQMFFVRSSAAWTPLLDPIHADELRAGRNWLHFMCERLAASPLSPLYSARFRIEAVHSKPKGHEKRSNTPGYIKEPPATPDVRHLDFFAADYWEEGGLEGVSSGAVLPLRRLTGADEGRLKWWRKVARENGLPPVLAWYVNVLEKHLVLDGHVRLRAAVDEGIDVPIVRVWDERKGNPRPAPRRDQMVRGAALLLESVPTAVTQANQILRDAYQAPSCVGQVGWPVPGGASAWGANVRDALSHSATLPDWVPDWLDYLASIPARRS
jgi:hypothetical protein